MGMITQLYYHCAAVSESVYHAHMFREGGIEVDISQFKDCTVIAVRGTDTRKDWIRNLRLWPTGAGKYCFHSGFWKGAKRILPSVAGYMELHFLHRAKKKPIVVTGHSQGAGVALCLARQLERTGHNVQYCVGFGSPRTMSRVNHKDLGFTYIHFRFGNDIVPACLPLGLFYSHVKPPIRVGVSSSIFPNWADHSISAYADALRDALKQPV